MISKELLSEVLGFGVYQSIRKDEYAYNDIKLNIINTELLYDYVNIYELAHKCKEWVLKQGYRIIIDCSKDIELGIRILKNGRDIYSNENKSEQQAIFKACQWILDNKEIK